MQRLLELNVCVILLFLLLLLPPQSLQSQDQIKNVTAEVDKQVSPRLLSFFMNMSSKLNYIKASPMFAIFGKLIENSVHPQNGQEFARNLAQFSMNMYSELSMLRPNQNFVSSPFAIQCCAAMVRLGADAETAAELDLAIGLGSTDPQDIARSFHGVLAMYDNSSILRIANRIYVMQGYELSEEFNSLLSEHFLSTAKNLDFSQSISAAATINGWVEQQTNNFIKDLIQPSDLDGNTSLVLINAIHFMGNWQNQFPLNFTASERFYLSETDNVNVSMMNLHAYMRYAALTDMDASVVELPYKDSDLALIIVLPNSITGLSEIEKGLKTTPLSAITETLKASILHVKLPRFKVEFKEELTSTFKEMGMSHMFTDAAEFGKMLKYPQHVKMSKIVHKAFIEVNETGTEAAAPLDTSEIPPMFKKNNINFHADHPFFYCIANKQNELIFAGKLLRP